MREILVAAMFTPDDSPGQAAESYRTDINPALRYYQAFLMAPTLNETNHQYVFETDWRGRTLDDRAEDLAASYKIAFQFLREAVGAIVPCDWGIDMSHGPETFLPSLAPSKKMALAGRLRAMWHLQHERPGEAAEDLSAVFMLARQVSQDHVLISALVGIALENIVASVVAETFYLWDEESLRILRDPILAAPPRGTVAQTVNTEVTSFYDWRLARIKETGLRHPDDEAAAIEGLRAFPVSKPIAWPGKLSRREAIVWRGS